MGQLGSASGEARRNWRRPRQRECRPSIDGQYHPGSARSPSSYNSYVLFIAYSISRNRGFQRSRRRRSWPVAAIALFACSVILPGQDLSEFTVLYREALSLQEQQSGANDPTTAERRLDLGLYLAAHGSGKEAETLIEQAYGVLSNADDRNPDRLADALETWAEIRLERGDDNGAEELLSTALSQREPLGDQWAGTLDRLAMLKQLQGRLEEADSFYRSALRVGRTAKRLRNLAIVLEAKSQSEEAERLHVEALGLQRAELADLNPETALTLNSLGLLAAQRQEWTAAARYLEESVSIFEETLGPESPEAATAIDSLGNVRRGAGDFDAAERLLKRALGIRRAALGESHPDTAATLNNLAGLYHVRGRLVEAEPLYQASIAARRAAFGNDDPEAATTLYNLAYLLQQKGESDAAKSSFREALRVLEGAYGTADALVGNIRRALDGLERNGRNRSAP